jgi:hypothetical protein
MESHMVEEEKLRKPTGFKSIQLIDFEEPACRERRAKMARKSRTASINGTRDAAGVGWDGMGQDARMVVTI